MDMYTKEKLQKISQLNAQEAAFFVLNQNNGFKPGTSAGCQINGVRFGHLRARYARSGEVYFIVASKEAKKEFSLLWQERIEYWGYTPEEAMSLCKSTKLFVPVLQELESLQRMWKNHIEPVCIFYSQKTGLIDWDNLREEVKKAGVHLKMHCSFQGQALLALVSRHCRVTGI